MLQMVGLVRPRKPWEQCELGLESFTLLNLSKLILRKGQSNLIPLNNTNNNNEVKTLIY